MQIKKFLLLLFFIIPILFSCENDREISDKRVVIGLSADPETLNPLYAFSVDEGVITEHLYLSLVQFVWDDKKGEIVPEPMLAKSWSWSEDSSSITFDLREDAKWSDGKRITVEDIIYSFDVFSDPEVQSRLLGFFNDFYTDKVGKVNVEKTFKRLSSNSVEILFKSKSNPTLPDIIFPILPRHIFSVHPPKELPNSELNFKPVSSGPYKLKKWDRNQMIVLEADKNSFLYNSEMIPEIIFKIIPDYNSRLTQLKKGEIDFVEQLKPNDAANINADNVKLERVKGREYDYIGWNMIDVEDHTKNKINANKFFGSAKVRKALAYAINRKEILSEYLYNFGELAVTPISPIFKEYYSSELKPLEFDPVKAKMLLAEEGWTDTDNNGTIDKNGQEFSFELFLPTGNPLREYSATLIKNNLRVVGIDMTIRKVELGALIEKLNSKSVSAWMAAWYVQIPPELKPYWYSDFNEAPLNFGSYNNPEVDRIILRLQERIIDNERIKLYKDFQKIIYEDNPAAFLYWIDNLVGINTRLVDLTIDPLGAMQKLWEWRVKQ